MNVIRRFSRPIPATTRNGPSDRREARSWQRGQVLVLFAGSMMAFMMLSALVVDVGWYWSSGLKIQRAADAAALAGAVYLPDNFNGAAPNAQTAALAVARRNGYVPDANTTISMSVDASNPRQLNVTISANVSTFFLRAVGIQTLFASRSSKAEFVLPVPMGSPQNYYGVGNFLNMVTPVINTAYVNPSGFNAGNLSTGSPPSANTTTGTSGGAWTNPGNAYTSNNVYATSATNLNQDAWKGFSFGSFQAGAIIDGVVINLEAKNSAVAAACKVKAEVSWNGGTTWGTSPQTTPTMTTSDAWYSLGSASNPAIWGANKLTWATTDFTTANMFEVRLTYLKGSSCGTESLDDITAVVYSHTLTNGTPVQTVQTVNGPTGSALISQGFWGADITRGGSRENGDQWGPVNDNFKGTSNPDYDGRGVDYTVAIAGSNGQVQLFDPTFCETGPSTGGGNLGAGDHWIAGSANAVTTTYTLYDDNDTPYDTSDDVSVASSGSLFANKIQADYSGVYGTPAHTGLTNCAADAYHNQWYQLASGLAIGNYRLNVSTNVAGNSSTNAENMWSAWVSSSTGSSQVYGQGKMVTYNNLVSGAQTFYLAQIAQVHAGKTMQIRLFDPGDVSGNASLRILSPDGNAYNYVNFSYTADNGRSGSGSSIQTASSSGGSFYQDALITITIPLPSTYGSVGLTPAGETGAGWWKIEYTVAGGNDTTSWQVDIQGNPVHLLVP